MSKKSENKKKEKKKEYKCVGLCDIPDADERDDA